MPQLASAASQLILRIIKLSGGGGNEINMDSMRCITELEGELEGNHHWFHFPRRRDNCQQIAVDIPGARRSQLPDNIDWDISKLLDMTS